MAGLAGNVSLNNKQRAFIEHYLACWNATQAAREAGYSEKTARAIGAENLTKPDIKAEINRRLSELKADADEVLTRLTAHARGSMEDLMDLENNLSLGAARANGALRLVKKLKEHSWTDKDGEQHRTREVELHDAQAALVQLGRHHKLFVDRTEHTGKDGSAIKVEYVNDWRGSAANAPPGAAVGEDASEALQLAGGGAPLEEDDAGDGDRG